jgi:60 kDa SS-A/Ro ribonucleoprotein
MRNAYTGYNPRVTRQSEPIPGEEAVQVKNNAGGFVYSLSPLKLLERFLILGSEGGSYYVTEKKLTADNAKNAQALFNGDVETAKAAVDLVVRVSDEGRAPKNDPAIFALALAASSKHGAVRAYALGKLPQVCRIPTHLFHFLTYVQQFRGWGRGLKRAVGAWYNDKDLKSLAYQLVKYQSRDGWSNADALRLSHPQASLGSDPASRNALYKWVVDGFEATARFKDRPEAIPEIVKAFETAKSYSKSLALLPELISKYNLSREMLPTEALNVPEVWEALLYAGAGMPYTAMLRNLGNMSKCGLLKPLSKASKFVQERLLDQSLIREARVHPLSILLASRTYGQGHGVLGKGAWEVVPAVRDALDEAFYLAFKSLEPTGKNFLFGVDISGSMSWSNSAGAGVPITAAEGAAAMALACAKVETNYHIMGFATSFVNLGITPKMSLKEAMETTRRLTMGGTDCSLPMVWAKKNKVEVDCFVVLTDSETWYGHIHPKQALKEYRDAMGIQAREVVVGMAATPFSIADPADPLTLDVVGFDASVPQILQEFVKA